MEKKGDFSNRIIRDAWLKEHGGKAVKEDNVWYWIAPKTTVPKTKPAVTSKKAKTKATKKKFF
jgi:hypothetical protein